MNFWETSWKYELQRMVSAQNITALFCKHGDEVMRAAIGGNLLRS
jgi:hypothetical protein